jgi:hypothetical protein
VGILSSSPQEAHTSFSFAIVPRTLFTPIGIASCSMPSLTTKSFVRFHRYKKLDTQAHTKEK